MSSRARSIVFLIVAVCIITVSIGSVFWQKGMDMMSTSSGSQAMMYDESDVTEEAYGAASDRALVGNIVARAPSYGGGATEVAANNRLVVRTGYLSLVVKDVAWTIEQITKYAAEHGGFIANSTLEKKAVAPVGSVTLRVAAKDYEATLQEMKNYGEVVSQTTNGQDITEEYVDLDSRLKNLQATEAQLLEIMKRAGKISEVLEVQNQLTQTRSEIEVITGRMKYLKQSAEFSTLTVNIATDPSALPTFENDGQEWKPVGVVKEALRELIAFGQSLVNVLIWVAIFSPLWGAALLILWLVGRRLRKPIV